MTKPEPEPGSSRSPRRGDMSRKNSSKGPRRAGLAPARRTSMNTTDGLTISATRANGLCTPSTAPYAPAWTRGVDCARALEAPATRPRAKQAAARVTRAACAARAPDAIEAARATRAAPAAVTAPRTVATPTRCDACVRAQGVLCMWPPGVRDERGGVGHPRGGSSRDLQGVGHETQPSRADREAHEPELERSLRRGFRECQIRPRRDRSTRALPLRECAATEPSTTSAADVQRSGARGDRVLRLRRRWSSAGILAGLGVRARARRPGGLDRLHAGFAGGRVGIRAAFGRRIVTRAAAAA